MASLSQRIRSAPGCRPKSYSAQHRREARVEAAAGQLGLLSSSRWPWREARNHLARLGELEPDLAVMMPGPAQRSRKLARA